MLEANSSNLSWAEQFRQLPADQRREMLDNLSAQEQYALLYDWNTYARPDQRLPEGEWTRWIIIAGRGYGKTRTGTENFRRWMEETPGTIGHIVVPTASDIHKVILSGPAGFNNICPHDNMPDFSYKDCTLKWKNGSKALIFSAEEPNRLRGPQCHKLWCDELAAWRYQQETWDQAMFGLRLGKSPQVIVTTTPRPTPLIKQLVRDMQTGGPPKGTIVTRGTTYDNRSNLAPLFYEEIIKRYEGTRLGRQEINAEILEDNPGALWRRENIEQNRRELPRDLARIVVAIDPSATDNENSDECGIVVVGRDKQDPAHFYVLADVSLVASPNRWAAEAIRAYRDYSADRIVAETNNGGDMVEAVIRNIEPNVSYDKVTASRGKVTRAEPVAALYEKNRVHHVGCFPKLEDQMCDEYDPKRSEYSPDRMDALVWAITELTGEGGQGIMSYYRSELEKRLQIDQSSQKMGPATADGLCGARKGNFVCNSRPHIIAQPHQHREDGRIVHSWTDAKPH